MCHYESWDKNMPVIIEKIIEIEKLDNNALIKIQQKRMKQLRAIEERKMEGKKIQTKKIILRLQSAGILDDHGDLALPYSDND